MSDFYVVIAGSRSFSNYELLYTTLETLLANKLPHVTIISGRARGADQLGEQYAYDKGLKVIEMPANWDLHGKRAGYLRNKEMAEMADAVVVFWDGQSPGTKHMIAIATEMNLPLRVIDYVI